MIVLEHDIAVGPDEIAPLLVKERTLGDEDLDVVLLLLGAAVIRDRNAKLFAAPAQLDGRQFARGKLRRRLDWLVEREKGKVALDGVDFGKATELILREQRGAEGTEFDPAVVFEGELAGGDDHPLVVHEQPDGPTQLLAVLAKRLLDHPIFVIEYDRSWGHVGRQEIRRQRRQSVDVAEQKCVDRVPHQAEDHALDQHQHAPGCPHGSVLLRVFVSGSVKHRNGPAPRASALEIGGPARRPRAPLHARPAHG